MDNFLYLRKKAIFLLVGAIILFLISIFYNKFYPEIISSNYLTEKFQKRLLVKEKKVDTFLNLNSSFQNVEDSIINFSYLNGIFQNHGLKNVSICIFHDDQLIYWSENNVQLNRDLILNNFNSNFLNISNGWYDIRNFQYGNYKVFGLIKLKNAYSYENDYLINSFADYINFPKDILISNSKDSNSIYNSENEYLFSFDFRNHQPISSNLQILLSFIFILAFSLLISSIYYFYNLLFRSFKYRIILFIAFVIDILLLRYLVFYFRFPTSIHSSELFDPVIFASSIFAPSLGDLLLNLVCLLSISYAFFKLFQSAKNILFLKSQGTFLLANFILFVIFLSFHYLFISLDKLVINSGISYNLADITGISFYSIVGFFCFGLYLFSFFLLSFKPILFVFNTIKSKPWLFIIIIFYSVIFSLWGNYFTEFKGFHFIYLFFFFLIFFYIHSYKQKNIRFTSTILFILLFSLFSTYSLNGSNNKKEKAKRLILAENLFNKKDPILEYGFYTTEQKIKSDTVLRSMLASYSYEEFEQYDLISSYIFKNYFNFLFSKYDIQLTICDSTRILDIQPDNVMINCYEYFETEIQNNSKPTDSKNLYFMDYEFSEDNYMGIIEFINLPIPLKFYIEIFNKNIPKGIGYPELLRDNKEESDINWSVYSYARYENGKLFSRFGKYFYATELDHYSLEKPGIQFFEKDGSNHLFYPVDESNSLIISVESPDVFDVIAPFSYISIFFGVLSFLFFLIFRSPIHISFSEIGFKKRLQFSITALIIFSFLIVGAGSLFYIVLIDQNKNISILSEKSHSVLIELEHKLAAEPDLPPEMEFYLSDLLYKFSLVFFSDINLYTPNGHLLATSRPEIFYEGLVSELINTDAFINLHDLDKSLFIHEEKIGAYSYLSAYLPFRNEDNKLVAYLNLPYFAKQDELTNEITTFLVAFLNIYVILIAFAIYIALIISNYITKPVELIKQKIGKLKLGKTAEKIEWKRKDEIGSLVAEYNRMVDELAESAELLAKSERESAWREMAKQIAHEIKNPLTPMKLSVQYLQKAWDEKDPDWDERLKRFSKTIVEQIDSLSIIASEFSDFAKMPRSNYQVIDLKESINSSIGIFKNSTKIKLKLVGTSGHFVYADKEQILRVFNNLIKNSIQAISDPSKGLININLYTKDNMHIIEISDNGKGIPEKEKARVFTPNFTTKTGGMGLGLALVKNIIENSNGTISFESEEEEGTTFTISLPIYSP